jgi:hypothetical protein
MACPKLIRGEGVSNKDHAQTLRPGIKSMKNDMEIQRSAAYGMEIQRSAA